jgi:GNAT superfamily N-acetyltransferase
MRLRDHFGSTLVARRAGRIVGSVAVEMYPDGGLVRSVAVAAELQGQGLGRSLTDAAFSMAKDAGIGTPYLLTTTAEKRPRVDSLGSPFLIYRPTFSAVRGPRRALQRHRRRCR